MPSSSPEAGDAAMPPDLSGEIDRADRADPFGSDELSQMAFLTVAEVARVLRVSRMTVYRLVHAGELASVRVGRSFRVPQRAVHDYLGGATPTG